MRRPFLMENNMNKYTLLHDMPGLKKGAIFEHYDHNHKDKEWGSIACGALVLTWIDGMCQQGWCAETFILPGQLAEDKKWFKLIKDTKCPCCGK